MDELVAHGIRIDAASVVTRLHDGTAILALGLGFLRAAEFRSKRRQVQSLDLLERALVSLKQLEGDLGRIEGVPLQSDVVTSLKQQADLLDIELDLRVTGSSDQVAPSVVEFLRLAGREALLNVRRHSGTRTCRIQLDFASCPLALRARDWGAGLGTGANGGHGLVLLRELADWLGCELVVGSQPGLGTELVIYGPRCAHAPKSLRSAPLAEEVVSS
jgi:signal transduction histidine kinase